jgi:modulator of FtsH protease
MNTTQTATLLTDQSQSLEQNKVLKNTYMLLAMTLLFSSITAAGSIALALPHPGLIITLVGYFGLLFLTNKFKDSVKGILCVFALSGFMGYTLGPILSMYWLQAPGVVMQSLMATGTIFIGMSFYAVTTKKDLGFMGSMLFVGVLVAFLAGLGALFFEIPALSLTVSAMFVLLMSAMILYETNQIVRGGETNYIMATVSLFVSIFNLFLSLMHLLGFAQSD